MIRCGWMGRCLLLALAVQAVGIGQTGDPREIDGAKTPEKIPDRYAYPMLFRRLAGAEGQKIFLRDSRMGEADAAVVFRAAERFEQLSTEGMSQIADARKNAPRPLPAPVMNMYRVLNERANDAVEAAKRSFEHEISAEGQTKLQAYLLNHVRRNMSVHLGEADIAAGLGPAPGEWGASARTAPTTAAPARQSTDLTGMEESAKALAVLRVIARDQDATIELWNGSAKEVAAYTVALCAPGLFLKQGLDTFGTRRPGIATGAVHELNVSKRSRPRCEPMTPRAVAVVFEDGTSAGIRDEIEAIKFGRLARMAEAERVHRILAAASGDGLPDWTSLRQQIGEMPEGEEGALRAVLEAGVSGIDSAEVKGASQPARFAMYSGVTHARSTILDEVNRPAEFRRPSPESEKAQWVQLREKYRKLSEEYRAFRERLTGSLYR